MKVYKIYKSDNFIETHEETHMGIITFNYWKYIVIFDTNEVYYFLSMNKGIKEFNSDLSQQVTGSIISRNNNQLVAEMWNKNTKQYSKFVLEFYENVEHCRIKHVDKEGKEFELGDFTMVRD